MWVKVERSDMRPALFNVLVAEGSHLNPWCVCVLEREKGVGVTMHTLDHFSSNRWAALECVRVLVTSLSDEKEEKHKQRQFCEIGEKE